MHRCLEMFSQRMIYFWKKNVTVLGDIFTQGNIIFEEGASAGQPGKITSVVARGTITFYGGNYVYGYVVSEGGGKNPEIGQRGIGESIVFQVNLFMKKRLLSGFCQSMKMLAFRDFEEIYM